MFRRILTTTRPFALPTPALRASRPFTQATPTLARKDTQHKDDLKPEPNEYSKSGSDDAAAAVENAAFDPKQTSPEEEMSTADKESGGEAQTSPLDVSPANHDVSQPKQRNEGGTGSPTGGQVSKNREQGAKSGGGGAPKSGGGKYGGGGGF
ncbi:hypothetical protein WHR41_01569 [Cladosporium halotolerans]|uniref:Uncharacterized protein n=1 Tax=Cladosporium halotolerans TaxID=1052096 RepID=A0AB34KZU1_9PEZI